MIELLAIPAWRTPPISFDAWVERLTAIAGEEPVIRRESPDGVWIEFGRLRFRGLALMVGAEVEALHFELAAVDPGPATEVIEKTAAAVGWEVHPDDGEEDDDSDDD